MSVEIARLCAGSVFVGLAVWLGLWAYHDLNTRARLEALAKRTDNQDNNQQPQES